jgi:hypothetical protein
MIYSQKGSVSRIVLGCFIVLAFCFALTWPKYSKQRNIKQLSQAAQWAKALAFAQESYKQAHGTYATQFNDLDLAIPCPQVVQEGKVVLECPHFTYRMEESAIIKANHKSLPVGLHVDIAQGTVACEYPQGDWAGKDLCSHLQ